MLFSREKLHLVLAFPTLFPQPQLLRLIYLLAPSSAEKRRRGKGRGREGGLSFGIVVIITVMSSMSGILSLFMYSKNSHSLY